MKRNWLKLSEAERSYQAKKLVKRRSAMKPGVTCGTAEAYAAGSQKMESIMQKRQWRPA